MGRKACIAVVALMCLSTGYAVAQDMQTAVAPLALTTPNTDDGVLQAGEWDDANSYYFDGVDPATNPGWELAGVSLPADDFNCTFYVKHDQNFVYVATVVVDDAIQNNNAAGGNQWEDDSMEVYFDADNDRSATMESQDANVAENWHGFQMSFNSAWGNGAGGAGGPGADPQWWWAASTIGGGGYSMEFRVDKGQTGMATGGTYGFDLSPDDDDDGDARDHQIWWNNTLRVDTAWSNEQAWGNIVLSPNSLEPPPEPPAAPTGLTATAGGTAIIFLEWTDNADNEQGFRILRSPDDTTYTEIDTVGPDVAGYADNGLDPATQYYYKVVAYNAEGDSADSNTANATTEATPAPIVLDEFVYAEGSDLIGQNGGIGWNGAWADRFSGAGDIQILGERMQYTGGGDRGWAADVRQFAAPFADGQVYYASWDIMYPSTVDWTATRAYPSFFLGTAGTDEVVNVGLVDPGAAPEWTIRAHTPSQVRTTSTAIVMDVEHHVVVQFVLDGTSDTLYGWVDPDLNLTGPDMQLINITLRSGTSPEIDHISMDLRECDGTWIDNFMIHQVPNPPRNFTAEPGSGRASLSWDPPSGTVLAGVKILRRNDRFPLNDTDGTVVYDGMGTAFEDFGVTTGETSYYTAFGYDQAGTLAEPVADSATVVQALGAENWKSYE